MIQSILGLFIILNIIFYIRPAEYFSELALSFLPYLTALALAGGIFSFIKLKKLLKTAPRKKTIRGLITIFCGLFFIFYSNQFNTFYKPNLFPQVQIKNTPMTILYANIHKNNTNYSDIENLITTKNPDIIMFVEFADHHYANLRSFLEKNYPYTNSTTRSKTFIGSTIFSKYKIENRADDFPQGRRRYAYFSVQPTDQKYYFYLVHTSSPDTYEHFIMRNNQLNQLLDDLHLHQDTHKDTSENTFIIGDFNMTPRSYDYKTFQTGLGSGFVDMTRQFPIVFTRKLFALPIFWAHIDHIRTNSKNIASPLENIHIPGSDHKGFLFTIPK